MAMVRAFVLLKAKVGMERELLGEAMGVAGVTEAHLIPGEYDVLTVVEREESPVDPREKVMGVVVEKLTRMANVEDTHTIIPSYSEYKPPRPIRPERRARAFVFIKTRAGKERGVLERLMDVEEVVEAHIVPGRFDVIAGLEFEKEVVPSITERVMEVVTGKVARIEGVIDTETYVPIESKYSP